MKTAAFTRKQEELRTFVMTMYGLLQPYWPEFWGLGYACLKHRRALEKEDERCSSVLSSSHSKSLMRIPRKLYRFHDKRDKTVESYRPGGKLCNKCRAYYYRKLKTNKRMSLLACVHTCFFCRMMNM